MGYMMIKRTFKDKRYLVIRLISELPINIKKDFIDYVNNDIKSILIDFSLHSRLNCMLLTVF